MKYYYINTVDYSGTGSQQPGFEVYEIEGISHNRWEVVKRIYDPDPELEIGQLLEPHPRNMGGAKWAIRRLFR